MNACCIVFVLDYSAVLSVAQVIQRRTVVQLMNNEMQRARLIEAFV
jgi:hypothetical protein